MFRISRAKSFRTKKDSRQTSAPQTSAPQTGAALQTMDRIEKSQDSKLQSPVVGIAAKHSHPDAPGLTRKLVFWLREKNIPFLVETSTAEKLDLRDVGSEQRISREALTAKCNPIVVLGGDGTLISVCRHPAKISPIIIGVNLGTLGFLTEITSEELFPALQAVLDGRAKLERRSLLYGSVSRGGKLLQTFSSINDIVITKQALARIFALNLYVDNQMAAVVRGDGIIVATPGGSTAYSMAAGGSIVHPQVDAVLVTPICPHSLSSRPLVLPGKSTVRLQIASDTTPDHVYLTIDGQLGMALESSDVIEITTSEHGVQFAKSPSRNYFEVLATTLKWATR